MTGSVVNLHAILPVTLRLPGRGDLVIDFVVDTGFTAPYAGPTAETRRQRGTDGAFCAFK